MYDTFDAARAYRLKSELDVLTKVLVEHTRTMKNSMDRVQAIKLVPSVDITRQYSNEKLGGTLYTIISTQLVDGAPLATIENIATWEAASKHRLSEIKEWYIKRYL
ncbi:hypothetical protein V8E51_018873 [Hyaloscypha variabilis]